MSNHIDPASAAWGLSLGLMLGAWIHDTLKNPGRRMVRPRRKTPPRQPSFAELLMPPRRDSNPSHRFIEGRTIRGNGHGGPSTAKPQFPPPRIIREDFLE
jgi:hypothetical protein